jgi:hypothetical protein
MTDDLKEAVERLLSAAKLLYANAEGCAVNHYGEDFALHGLPGWLAGCAADIETARSALEACRPRCMRAPLSVSLKEAVERLERVVAAFPDATVVVEVCKPHPDNPARIIQPIPLDYLRLVLSALKAAERPQPVPGDGEGVKAELAREEIAHGNTIDQRDAAEEALSRAYFLVAGRHPPWSNVFQYSDALAEIEETLAALSRVSTPGREEIQYSVSSRAEARTAFPDRLTGDCAMAERGGSAKPDPSCDCFREWRECRAEPCKHSARPPRAGGAS